VYLLLSGREGVRVAQNAATSTPRVRFGSKGPRAEKVQQALADHRFYEGLVDGDFGARSLRGLVEFQRRTFGPGGVDGICGPQTLSALGLPPF
jgi:peptidoglycan hydrolase-like protein with peptidoglycan-binding domain